ncbi:MAG TPA: tyrosine-type recombinase/integrase [Acidimicrobiales bacterium]|nr:tyrosine-type recombinase/integrase [Acidimicrobiales bacterium]
MSSVKRDVSGAWRARWRDPSGQSRSRNFERKAEAERFLTTVEGSKLFGAYVDPSAGRVLFGDYATSWAAAQIHSRATTARVASLLDLHVLPFLGARPLAAIRPSELQAWIRGRSDVLEPATVSLVYRYTVAILRAAVADRLLGESPARGIKLPRSEPRHVVPLETEIVEALIAAVPDRYRALVVLAAGTGLRQGEAFGLTTDRVDFLRRTLTVDRQLVAMPRCVPVMAAPKSSASRRTVPLPTVVTEALAAHLARYPAGPGELIFTTGEGQPIRRVTFGNVWRIAVAKAGAPAGTGFHALRHYYASLLIRHGESVKVVQVRLGHASARETLDTYSHLWPDSEDQTRAAVDSVLGAAVSDPCQTATVPS